MRLRRRNPAGLAIVLAIGFVPDFTVRTERVVAVRAIIKINLGCHWFLLFSPFDSLPERIAFYPQSLEAIKLQNVLASATGDKTCWTKPRSRTEAAVMGICKQQSSAQRDV